MQRFLRDSPVTLALEARDEDGTVITAASACSVAISDSAGVAITGSPFSASGASGVFSVSVPAATNTVLDLFDVVATFTIAAGNQRRRLQYEVVGGWMFEIPDLRVFDPELADTSDPTGAQLRTVRDAAQDRFQRHCRPAFWRRGRRVTLDGNGLDTIVLPDLYPRTPLAVSIDGVAMTSGELAALIVYDWGGLKRPDGDRWTKGARNVVVFNEHGLDSLPESVSTASMRLARSYLVKSPLPDRATSETTDVGTFRIAVAGRDGPTGIPDVDAILAEFSGGDIVVG